MPLGKVTVGFFSLFTVCQSSPGEDRDARLASLALFAALISSLDCVAPLRSDGLAKRMEGRQVERIERSKPPPSRPARSALRPAFAGEERTATVGTMAAAPDTAGYVQRSPVGTSSCRCTAHHRWKCCRDSRHHAFTAWCGEFPASTVDITRAIAKHNQAWIR